jgi:hypothetical protein
MKPLIQLVLGAVSRGQSGRSVKISAHLHLLPRLRMLEIHLHFQVRLHSEVLNY